MKTSHTSMKTINDNLDGIHRPPNLRKVKACGYCAWYKRGGFHCQKFDAIICSSCLCDDFEGTRDFKDANKTGGLNNAMER